MKRAFIIILVLISLIGAACEGQKAAPTPTQLPPKATEPPIYYSLVVDVDPPEGGIAVPASEQVEADTMVRVEAKPGVGYEFTGWSGAVSLSAPSLEITMDGDKNLTAHFTKLATNTPLPPTVTPTPESSPTPEEAEEAENSLTEWCNEHVGCESFEVKNQSTYAIGIILKHQESGIEGNFWVAPKGNLHIMLRPGYYYYRFSTCGGTKVYEGYHPLGSRWYWITKAQHCN